jgi:protein involved in polysaccharide export with SLBB domain
MKALLLTGLVLGSFAAFAQVLTPSGTNNFPPPLFNPLPVQNTTNSGLPQFTPLGTSNRLSAAVPNLSGYVADVKSKLRPGDKVSLQILEDREPARSLVVADSGELDVPYIGRVMVAQKSCKEAAQELKTSLEKEYYYRATVVLALDVANKLWGRIYVWGQVRNQGPIDIGVNENITAGKAILRAGGFADFANRKRVKVVRAAGQGSGAGREPLAVNMVEVLEEGRTEKDVRLEPDDTVIVPSRLINF